MAFGIAVASWCGLECYIFFTVVNSAPFLKWGAFNSWSFPFGHECDMKIEKDRKFGFVGPCGPNHLLLIPDPWKHRAFWAKSQHHLPVCPIGLKTPSFSAVSASEGNHIVPNASRISLEFSPQGATERYCMQLIWSTEAFLEVMSKQDLPFRPLTCCPHAPYCAPYCRWPLKRASLSAQLGFGHVVSSARLNLYIWATKCCKNSPAQIMTCGSYKVIFHVFKVGCK